MLSRFAKFPVQQRSFALGDASVSLLMPTSMDALLEGRWLAHYERLGYLPYWADVWPAALGVAEFLLCRADGLEGRSVLDLGCGLGLAGIAAGLRGASVTFADRDPDALEFARCNAERCGVVGVQTLRLDWHLETAPARYDVLLLADVAYEKEHHEPLLRHVRRCLAPGGYAVFGDPYRAAAHAFVGMLLREFTTEQHEGATTHEGKRVPVRIMVIHAAPA